MEITNATVKQALNDPNFSFIDTFADASDTQNIRKELTRLLFLNKTKRRQLQERERERVQLVFNYEKKKRESYIKHSKTQSITEKMKTVLVDIDVEKEKFNLEVLDQKIKEINRDMAAIKLEIDTLKTIGYSLKSEMSSF